MLILRSKASSQVNLSENQLNTFNIQDNQLIKVQKLMGHPVNLANRDNKMLQKPPRALLTHLSRTPRNKLNMKSLLLVTLLSALVSLSTASITLGKCPVTGANNPDFDPEQVQGDPSGWLKPSVDLDLGCSVILLG